MNKSQKEFVVIPSQIRSIHSNSKGKANNRFVKKVVIPSQIRSIHSRKGKEVSSGV